MDGATPAPLTTFMVLCTVGHEEASRKQSPEHLSRARKDPLRGQAGQGKGPLGAVE